MKQFIDLDNEEMSKKERDFIVLWKERKYSDPSSTLSVGECWELLIALKGQHHETSVIDELIGGSYFNNVLLTEDLVLAYEGEELVDILFYNVRKELRRRFALARFFPE